MEIHSYNQELAIASTQFKRFFNDITVVRNGEDVKFACVIGNRSRIFKNLENPTKGGMPTLPMIIIQRTGISKNNDRLTNVYNDVAAERVTLFQRQAGMTEDGIASQELQAYLFSDKAPVCGQPLPRARSPVMSKDGSRRVICGCCMGEGCECCHFTGWIDW